MNNISKEQFDSAYNKHLPNAYIRFAFKYFSKETEKKNMVVNNSIVYTLLILFFLGMFGTIFNASRTFMMFSVLSYAIILSLLVLFIMSAIALNNRRLKKVMEELDITIDEYNSLVKRYYP